MIEGTEPSFGRLVVNRAWFSAWAFFKSRARDAIVFLALFGSGGAVYYQLYGWPAAKEQIVPVIVFTIGPIAVLWLLLFIWHLWLAPSALAYEAAKLAAMHRSDLENPASGRHAPAKEKTVNWAAWKQRTSYTLREFAAILAKVDPSNELETSDRVGFFRLIQEDAMSNNLKTVRDRLASGREQPDIYPEYFTVQKDIGIAWAKSKNFDVSHVA